MLSDEALERIIAATKLDGSDIDRKRLAKDLELNRVLYKGAPMLKPPVAKQDRKNLELLSRDVRRALSDFLPRRVELAALALISETDSALERSSSPAKRYRDVFKKWSPFDALVGFGLPAIYKIHFGRDAGTSLGRKDKPSGPFIRFADHALLELDISHNGKPYAAASIARAFTRVRAGHVRNQGSQP
jgi:hypothetical protein